MSALRRKLLEADIQAVKDDCKNFDDCPFKDFHYADGTFGFTYADSHGPLRHVSINCSEDYPDQTAIAWSDDPHNQEVSRDRLQVIFNKIAEAVGSRVRVSIPDNYWRASLNSPMDVGEEEGEREQGEDEMERSRSSSSHYSDCKSDVESDDNEEDYEDYYKDKDSEDEEIHMHHLLSEDMDSVRSLYGEKSISYRLFGTIDDIDVELHIGLSFLDPEIAMAWKLICHEPIIVRLHLSLSRYLDATEPKVEVFQPSQKENFGVGRQLGKILEQFIFERWKYLTNDIVETERAKNIRPRKVGTSLKKRAVPSQVTSVFGSVKEKLRGMIWSDESGSSRPAASDVKDKDLAQIVDIGFSTEMARNALIMSRGNVEEALNLLLSVPESCMVPNMEQAEGFTSPTGPSPPSPSVPKGRNPKAPLPPLPGPANKVKVKGRSKVTSVVPSEGTSVDGTDNGSLEELNLHPSSTQKGKSAKQVPDLANGFLSQVMQYTKQRLPTLNEYCVVCDEPHVFQNGAMLKPAVCARELCVFGFQTLGVMSHAAEDIATGAEVVDLLIVMAIAACRSPRHDVILEPYPTVVDPTNKTELALTPKKKDYKRVEKALDSFPEMPKMMRLVGSDLKKEMDKQDILCYPLLQWIITSNRSHIVKLPPEKQIIFMHTPHQFLLMSSPPAKEAVFRAAKQKYGSTFAFHGSHIENWHSIMRTGLINASGTKHQVHGSAYGKGIYLSPQASVSFNYSGMGYGHHKPTKGPRGPQDVASHSRFLKSKNLTCIALCEIITHKDLKKHNNIWVMPQADYCCTRFFFVYEDGQVGDSNIDTQEDKYRREIMRAVEYQTR